MTTASAARNRRPFSAVNVSDFRTTAPLRNVNRRKAATIDAGYR
ncbi:MAG: hypothetical protein ABSF78_01045 [Candidatus Acidiferrales bacterium]